MARFQLKSRSGLKQVGEKIQALSRMSGADFRLAKRDANDFFSDVFAIPDGITIKLQRDSASVRHVVVPFYPDPMAAAPGPELLGVITICGCSD